MPNTLTAGPRDELLIAADALASAASAARAFARALVRQEIGVAAGDDYKKREKLQLAVDQAEAHFNVAARRVFAPLADLQITES